MIINTMFYTKYTGGQLSIIGTLPYFIFVAMGNPYTAFFYFMILLFVRKTA